MEKVDVGITIAIILVILCLLVGVCSCQTLTDEQGKKFVRIDPVVSDTIERAVESGTSVLAAMAPVIPYATPIAAMLAGALAVWKKNKKTIVTMQNKTEAVETGAKVLTDFIDYIKVEHPAWWEKMRNMLDTKIKSTEGAQDTITEIRSS